MDDPNIDFFETTESNLENDLKVIFRFLKQLNHSFSSVTSLVCKKTIPEKILSCDAYIYHSKNQISFMGFENNKILHHVQKDICIVFFLFVVISTKIWWNVC